MLETQASISDTIQAQIIKLYREAKSNDQVTRHKAKSRGA